MSEEQGLGTLKAAGESLKVSHTTNLHRIHFIEGEIGDRTFYDAIMVAQFKNC